jgi:TolA-binding protein
MRLLGLLLCALLAFPVLSFGQKKEYVELQRDIALLQDQVRSLQTSMNEKLAQLQMLVQQSLDSSNKANTAVAVLDSGIRDRMRDQEKSVAGPVAGVGAKLDQFAEEFRALKESVGDMSGRMGKLQAQIVDLGNAVKVMQSPPPPPSGGGAGGAPPSGVSADQLYQSAMRDRSAGSLDLAMQEFNDFLRYFPSTDLAPNAQFYLAMIYYDKGDMDSAIRAFDLVLEKFPENGPLCRWIDKAQKQVRFQGLPSRICWLGYGERAAMGKIFNDLVARGEVVVVDDRLGITMTEIIKAQKN